MSAEYRGLWLSFLDFPLLDFSCRERYTDSVRRLCDRCGQLGLNHIIFHLRPFGDALYASRIFPWSHLICGSQGTAPAFDPLELLIREASAAGQAVDAWINPYRIAGGSLPVHRLSPDNPGVRMPWLTTSWQSSLYYNPALPEAVQLIADGVGEIVDRYDVAAVQFDDYFYPTTAPEFDLALYRQANTPLSLADWRRENVNRLVRTVYRTVHEKKPQVQFGISPHGNDWRNRCQQYSDTALWMREPGYLDFLLPQLYYGFQPTLQDGRTVAFADGESGVEGWLGRPRHPRLSLYFGLPAYLVAEPPADGNAGFWGSGRALADFVETLHQYNAQGYALFRAANLVAPDCGSTLGREYEALRTLITGGSGT